MITIAIMKLLITRLIKRITIMAIAVIIIIMIITKKEMEIKQKYMGDVIGIVNRPSNN